MDGRFKNKIGERLHLMIYGSVNKSGFRLRKWVERLGVTLWEEAKTDGTAICDQKKICLNSHKVSQEFRE